jgi:hypothetical protein
VTLTQPQRVRAGGFDPSVQSPDSSVGVLKAHAAWLLGGEISMTKLWTPGSNLVKCHNRNCDDGSGYTYARDLPSLPQMPAHAEKEALALAEEAAFNAEDHHFCLFNRDGREIEYTDERERAELCALVAYAEYRRDLFNCLRVECCNHDSDKLEWPTAIAFAEEWLRSAEFRALLQRIAYIQYEPEPDEGDFWPKPGEGDYFEEPDEYGEELSEDEEPTPDDDDEYGEELSEEEEPTSDDDEPPGSDDEGVDLARALADCAAP